jgi:GAF domain-containing protein
MDESRLERLLDLVQRPNVDRSLTVPVRICWICSTAIGVDGAGVSLLSPTVHRSLGASDPVAAAVEQSQIELGEGPCVDAYRDRAPALEPDLESSSARRRWPSFASRASEFGVRAIFGFPLMIGNESIGALDLYSRSAKPLGDSDLDDAMILADLAALAIQAHDERNDDTMARLDAEPTQGWAYQSVVHNASGMTAAQLDISVDEALVRLRTYAFAADRRLADVAGDVVARRLRMENWSTRG